jgi:hypothetical protein
MIESSLPPQAQLPEQPDLQTGPELLPARPLWRVVRSIAGYGLLTAFMALSPLVVFVPTSLFHCGLRNGRRAAWMAMLIAAALSVGVAGMAIAAVAPAEYQLQLSFAVAIALAIMVPSVAALPLIERGVNFGRVVAFLTAGAAIGLAATEALMRIVAGFSPYLLNVAEAKQAATAVTALYKLPAAAGDLMMRWGTLTVPASLLIRAVVMFGLSLLMLGRLKAWREHAARRNDAPVLGAYLFRNFSLPEWVLLLFVVGGLTPIATGLLQKVAANTLMVVTFLYLVQGLAIFRGVLVAAGAGFGATMIAWMVLAFFTMLGGAAPLLLGLAGLFDPFFNFRHIKRKDDSHESHTD